uniref:Glycosyltransferase n=1 Tax=Triadica sebifera TaxID=139772 RepID=A0A7S6PSA9_TRISB|nr:UF3GT [Triadica sebifera]
MPRTAAVIHPHVVVFAIPFGSHVTPLFSIINRLANFYPNALFSFFCTQKANKTIFSTYRMGPNVKVFDLWDGIPEGYVFTGKHQEEIELFMKAAPESFRNSLKASVAETGREVTCLVTDAFYWFAPEMAEEMKVPWLACWTAAATSISVHFYTDFIRETYGVGGPAGNEETLNLIPGMSKIQIADLPEGVLFGNLESLFSEMLHKMGRVLLAKSDAVFINSYEELDPIITNDLKSRFKQLLSTGPFNLVAPPSTVPADTHGCLAWLDKQKPGSVACISFGSVATPPPHEFPALAEALEATKVPFIWSLKDHAKVHLPNGFVDTTKSQGLIVPWIPQTEVLAHSAVGVFITHCGWNSVLESIEGGVPMICRPFFGDQRLNARTVQDVWEIGLKVEGGVLTKNGVIDCLDHILWQEKGKKMRENVRLLKELAERAIEPEGSSYKNFMALAELVTS